MQNAEEEISFHNKVLAAVRNQHTNNTTEDPSLEQNKIYSLVKSSAASLWHCRELEILTLVSPGSEVLFRLSAFTTDYLL